MQIHDVLTPKRISPRMPVSSKKRMLEGITALLREDVTDLDANAAFQSLVERERLGSTAIGHGVALPHSRVKGLKKAIGAFATLAQDVDYDAADSKPVNIVFALLLPEDAGADQLELLSGLAAAFANTELRQRLLSADDPQEIYQTLTRCDSVPNRKAG